MLIEAPPDAGQQFKDIANTGECWIVLGKATTATFFPLGKNRMAVGIGMDEQVQAEIWRTAGTDPNLSWIDLDITTKKKIAELLANDCSFQNNMLFEAFEWIPDWNSYKLYLWKMRDSDVATQPYNEEGNIILIGDAAHAIMPTIGMGASLAIEDAEILGQHLSEQIQLGHPSFKRAVENYASLRVPVWKDLMARARAAARLNFIGIRHKNRFAVGPQIPGPMLWKVVSKIEELIS
jgi:2-polyprenyl-6-methoxyphenol hydroxylase-like FAD-dependent oxidoreductase